MTIIAKDGTVISVMGNIISTSNGETYALSGSTLTGPGGMVSLNVGSIREAASIVAGRHGGRQF